MTVKEIKELYNSLEKRMANLEVQMTNHCGYHRLERVVNYLQLILMGVVIFLLKFKVL